MNKNVPTTVIFGCGNIVMGDDGFGPEVVAKLQNDYDLPQDVQTIDADTGIREYLFDYLLAEEIRPQNIIILDAVDFPNKEPGDVFTINPNDIPAQKIHDFSLHQFPTVNLLQELEQHTGIRVIILAGQVEYIPEEITPGLTPAMSDAVNTACEEVVRILSEQCK
ncbi:hydrogenase maturation protease [Desulfopila sp. IMCC35008]|uniref:hydrogenase maturation protease n=1 Tax=Desulfopila sp. IMCC35008 TaxID=2653858 RepID=UPI0013D4C167|nr:hydrogenase maturation protease [Desulfopila sp. IMCC35008]